MCNYIKTGYTIQWKGDDPDAHKAGDPAAGDGDLFCGGGGLSGLADAALRTSGKPPHNRDLTPAPSERQRARSMIAMAHRW